jgi:carboxyl-terminal processing protease
VLVAEGARLDAVRVASEADVAGLKPGQVITHIEDVPVAHAIAARLEDPRALPEDRQWALHRLLAGPRSGAFRLRVLGEPQDVVVERQSATEPAAFLTRAIGEHRDIAYVRPGFAAKGTRERAWAQGLHEMRAARAVVLDLRATHGPTTRAETLELLATFAHASGPWQLRRDRAGKTYTDTVTPAPWAVRVPLVVLVDRWTAGEAESLAAGLHAVADARLIGTPMAVMHGELQEIPLASSGIALRYPAQRVFTPDGTPREKLVPDVPVDLAAPSGGPGDPILYQALKLLER